MRRAMEAPRSRERVLLYIGCEGNTVDSWYRVEFEASFPKTQETVLREPGRMVRKVGEICQETYGGSGGWDVIGENIYWVGGWKNTKSSRISVCEDLLKHNMKHFDPSFWEIESSSMNIHRKAPLLFALSGNRLCVVSGSEWRAVFDFEDPDDYEDRCGEMYDLNKKTWTPLECPYNLVCKYNTSHQVCLVQKDGGEEPTQVVFYSLYDGSVVFVDVTGGGDATPKKYAHFDIWPIQLDVLAQKPLPKGLNLNHHDINILQIATSNKRAVFTSNTFYWLAPDLRVFGYDTQRETWLQSHSLKEQLPLVVYDLEGFQPPTLVCLGNDKFLLIAPDDKASEKFTIASLTVAKVEESSRLSVSVGSVRSLFFEDDLSRTFWYCKAMLNNTG